MKIVWIIVAVLATLSAVFVPGVEDDTYMPLVRGGVASADTATSTTTTTATSTATSTSTSTATSTATATATATLPVQGPCPCNADARNCTDFATQPQAQACFTFCFAQAGDIHKLDQDNDNIACESLPPFVVRVIR